MHAMCDVFIGVYMHIFLKFHFFIITVWNNDNLPPLIKDYKINLGGGKKKKNDCVF